MKDMMRSRRETPMNLLAIADDKELYKEYRNFLRGQSRIAISIHNASDEHKTEIENALQELLTAEVIKQAHDDLRARGVSDEFLDERDLRSSLEGVPLPERDRKILESKVRLLARRMRMPKDGGDGGRDPGDGESRPRSSSGFGTIQQASHTAGHTFICMVSGTPGTPLSLSGVKATPPPGSTFATIGVFLQIDNIWGRVFSGDALRLRVDPGAAFGIGSSQMQVGLASAVSWAKEIYAWNLCQGKLTSVYQSGPNSTPNFMLLTKGSQGADTIVFTKPQFAGVWADVSNFDFRQFWSVFGGMKLTFTWLTD